MQQMGERTMSFTIVEQAPARLNRSELAVPGSSPKLFEKAAASAADVVFLDLEDAVAPDEKEQARKNVIEGINDIDWGSKTLSVRINGLDTHYMYRDVVDVIEQGGDRLDLIMIPKVGTAADVTPWGARSGWASSTSSRRRSAWPTWTPSRQPARATRACISASPTMPPRPRRGPP
jgi:citrate lyase beta subunit